MVQPTRRGDDGGMNATRSTGLVRPRDERMIAGVCAGLARRFGLSATTVRVLFVLSLLLPGPQVLVYLALWVLMPDEPWA